MGYRFQFVTLAGFHALNLSMFDLAHAFAAKGCPRTSGFRTASSTRVAGYSATRHQSEVGTSYFDRVSQVVSGGTASTLALVGSTERAQFRTPDGTINGANGHGRTEPSRDA